MYKWFIYSYSRWILPQWTDRCYQSTLYSNTHYANINFQSSKQAVVFIVCCLSRLFFLWLSLINSTFSLRDWLTFLSIWVMRQIVLFAHVCALHHLIYYAMPTSSKSFVTRWILKRYSYLFALKIKYLYSYIHDDSIPHFSPRMRKNVYRKYNSPSKSKAYSCLYLEINKTVI